MEKTADINQVRDSVFQTLETVMGYRSLESSEHIKRTTELTRILTQNMLLNPKFHDRLIAEDYKAIIKVVFLHDIGKIGIPDYILIKPGKLTDGEYEIMKTHVTIGSEIIAGAISPDMKDDIIHIKHCKDIIRFHHEWWDGNGYLQGLKGEEIPLSARILSVVDVYDALAHKRCYKDAYSHDEAVAIIAKGSGTQFDPDIVDSFLEAAPALESVIKAII